MPSHSADISQTPNRQSPTALIEEEAHVSFNEYVDWHNQHLSHASSGEQKPEAAETTSLPPTVSFSRFNKILAKVL